MPAQVAPQTSTPEGVVLDYAAPPADGDAVPPGCRVLLRNTSAGAITGTVVTGGTQAGLNVEDVAFSVAAGSNPCLGPFLPRETFAQPSGADAGRVLITYSAVAGLERAAVTA
jgi:hypothetical protein